MFLIFSKGEAKKRGYIKDTIHIVLDKKNSKEREFGHPHEKYAKVAEKILKAISKEGDIVLDPFCGTGSFLDVAKRMKRKYIGYEIDKNWYGLAQKRLDLIKD